MVVSFWVVDESLLTLEVMQAAALVDPQEVMRLTVEQGGPWGEVELDFEGFTQVFEMLGRTARCGDFLENLALQGSPHLVLTGHPGDWSMGYFEASLVQHLQPIFNHFRDELAAEVATFDDPAQLLYTRFRQSLDEAFMRQCAVAIEHLE